MPTTASVDTAPRSAPLPHAEEALDWPLAVFAKLREADVTQVVYVPDAGHARLIDLCRGEPAMATTVLTTEEEGIAMLAGAHLGGRRGVLLMQSSGVGNCINMLSLSTVCRFPALMLVTMRGDWGELNPWQIPMGQKTAHALELAGVLVQHAERPEDAAETVESAARFAFSGDIPVAVLLRQRMIGTKLFKD